MVHMGRCIQVAREILGKLFDKVPISLTGFLFIARTLRRQSKHFYHFVTRVLLSRKHLEESSRAMSQYWSSQGPGKRLTDQGSLPITVALQHYGLEPTKCHFCHST